MSLSQVYQRAKYGAAWWSHNLFKAKTFVEARSIAAPFVAFWRVYTFHAVLFTAMMAVVSPCTAAICDTGMLAAKFVARHQFA